MGLMEELGWKIVEDPAAEYCVKQESLSAEEARLLDSLVKKFKERTREGIEGGQGFSAVLKQICEEEAALLEKSRAKKIVSLAESIVKGYGILDGLLQDPELEEISVVGLGKPVYVFHRKKGWMKTNCVISSEEFALNAINKMARPLGRRITYQNPRINAALPDGSRLHASIDPINLNKFELTIRKFRQNPFTVGDLIANGTVNAELAAFLWMVLFGDASLLIAGNSGSGKTTTLNALFSFIPFTERVIITEETPEINLPHEHQVKIVANEELGIQMKDLIKDTLRMRPDRVVIGEVRSREEVAALFDSLLSGQARGSYATMHAGSASEALARLQALGAGKEDLNAINLILVQRRLLRREKHGQRELRRVTELVELAGGKQKTLFSYSPQKDFLEKKSESALFERITTGYGLGRKEALQELAARKEFLEEISGKELSFKEFNEAVQKWFQ